MTPAKNTAAAVEESTDYTFDRKTLQITMADGFTFSPFDPDQTKQLTPAQTRAALIECGQLEPTEVSVDIMPTLRLVEEGETAPSKEDVVEHYAALVVAAEAAAAELKADAAKFTADAESAKAELRKILEPGKHQAGNVTVSITEPSRSFDADLFRSTFPVETHHHYYMPAINAAAVPPNIKDQFMAPGKGERKVTIK